MPCVTSVRKDRIVPYILEVLFQDPVLHHQTPHLFSIPSCDIVVIREDSLEPECLRSEKAGFMLCGSSDSLMGLGPAM